jgi:hypothetical protein
MQRLSTIGRIAALPEKRVNGSGRTWSALFS